MRNRTIVVTILLAMPLARPAVAQTSGWDFSSKAPAAKASETPAEKDAAAPKTIEAVVAKKTTPSEKAAVAKKPDALKEKAASSWGFAATRPADVATTAAAKPVPRVSAARTAGPSHAAPALNARSGRTDSRPPGVRLLWIVPAAIDRGATTVPSGGVTLQWSSETSRLAVATSLEAELLAPAEAPPEAAAATAPSAPTAAPEIALPAAAPVAAVADAAPSAPAQVAKPVEPLRPQPTGLERLSDDWPKAVKVGVQYRGRSEEQRGSSITNGRDDGYYLNRIRLEGTVTLKPWLKGFAQVQDAQTLGYNIAAQPLTNTDTLDLRQGYVEARWPSANGFGVRAGRQEISLGEQRLVGGADWNNTARSFDAVRVFFAQPGVQVDAFVSSVVVIEQGAFDRWKPNEKFSGTYVSLSRIVPKSVVEPYLLVRNQSSVAGELGQAGDGATYTFGARAAGLLPRRFDYGVEVAVQRGHIATDAIDAWAGHYALGWTIVPSKIKPRFLAEFNNASGDSNPKDGRRETFDQLYPTNHNKYGIADQMGWRNMRDAMMGIELSPAAKLKLSTDVHRLFLATTADGLYSALGTQKVLNRGAASRTVGTELDFQSVYAFSKELSLAAGVSGLFAGDYLVQSTSAGTLWTPYLMWNLKF